MAIQVELYDGTPLEFPDDTDKSVIEKTARRITLEKQAASNKAPEDLGFMESARGALKRGVGAFKEIGSGLGLAASSITGTDEETRQKMEAIKEQNEIDAAKQQGLTAGRIQDIYKEKGLAAAARQVPQFVSEQFLQSAPGMAVPLAAAAATSPFLTPLGGTAVGIATYGVQQFGNFLVRQAQEKNDPKELEVAKAALTATGTAPFGYIADKFTVGIGSLGKKAGTEIGAELAKRKGTGLAGRVLTGSTAGIIAEAPTEVLETAAERWQAGLPLDDKDAKNEYFESFFGAAAVGGTAGALAGAMRGNPQSENAQPSGKYEAIPPTEPTTPPTAPLQLTNQEPFTPVTLPDGSVATTQEQLDEYNASVEPKQLTKQEPFTPVTLPDGSVATTQAQVDAYNDSNLTTTPEPKRKIAKAKLEGRDEASVATAITPEELLSQPKRKIAKIEPPKPASEGLPTYTPFENRNDVVATFRTGRGSTYGLYDDNSTQRNRSGENHKDTTKGLQPKSRKTIFMDTDSVNSVAGVFQNPELPTALVPDGNGTASLIASQNHYGFKQGQVLAKVPYTTEPKKGLHPVEIFNEQSPLNDAGEGIHFGNKITEVNQVGGKNAKPRTIAKAKSTGPASGAVVPLSSDTTDQSTPTSTEGAGVGTTGEPIVELDGGEEKKSSALTDEQQSLQNEMQTKVDDLVNKGKTNAPKTTQTEPPKTSTEEEPATSVTQQVQPNKLANTKAELDKIPYKPNATPEERAQVDATRRYVSHYGDMRTALSALAYDTVENVPAGGFKVIKSTGAIEEQGSGREYEGQGGVHARAFADYAKTNATPQEKKHYERETRRFERYKKGSEAERRKAEALEEAKTKEKAVVKENRKARRAINKAALQTTVTKPEEAVAETKTAEEINDAKLQAELQAELEEEQALLAKEEKKEKKVVKGKIKSTEEEFADISTEAQKKLVKELEEEFDNAVDDAIDEYVGSRRYSQTETAGKGTGNTVDNVRKATKKWFRFDEGFNRLVTIVQDVSDLPFTARPTAKGVAYKGRVYLVANNIKFGNELGVLLHELGAHVGFDLALKSGEREYLANTVRKWAKGSDLKGKAAQTALAKGGSVDDEIIAYMVEELVNRGVTPQSYRPENTWLRRIYAALKSALSKIGFRKDLTEQDLVNAAFGAAHIAIKTPVVEFNDEIRETNTKKTDWAKLTKYKILELGTDDIKLSDARPIGAFGPVANAGVIFTSTPHSIEAQIVDLDVVPPKRSAKYVAPAVVDTFYLAMDGSTWNSVYLGTSGVISPEVIKKYKDVIFQENGYFKFKRGLVGDQIVRTAFRSVREMAINQGIFDKINKFSYVRETGASSKNKPGAVREISKEAVMRFSLASPALDAADAEASRVFSGPPPAKGIIQGAIDTVTRPDRFARTAGVVESVRKQMADKNAPWEELFVDTLGGNNSLDAAGAASGIDRMQAASKTHGIALATLELGGFRKNSRGMWEAYKTDANYVDIIKKLQSTVGKYKKIKDFNAANYFFNMAVSAKREQGLASAIAKGEVKPTLTADQIKFGLEVYNDIPEIAAAAQLYTKFKNHGVDGLVAAGVITSEQAAEWKEYSDYVPWNRWSENDDGSINIPSPRAFAKGLMNKSMLKDLKGGSVESKQINNILDNMAHLSNWMVAKSVSNDTSAYMVDYAQRFGIAGRPIAKRVGAPDAAGVNRANTVQVMRNGIPHYYEFTDPAFVPAFRGFKTAHGAMTEFFAAPANLVRRGVTSFPIFALGQLPQDAMRAFVAGGLRNPYAVIPRVLTNFMKELFSTTTTGERLKQFGVVGRGGDVIPGEAGRTAQRRLGLEKRGMFGKLWDTFEAIQNASDAATRTALYELTMKETGNEVLAIRRAREIINFDTQGSSEYASFLRQTVPFMGVYMNDLNNLYKGLVLGSARLSEGTRNQTRLAIIYRGMQLAILTSLYTMMVGDDDDYKKLDDSTRNRSLIIPETNIRIPVPGDGIGFLFKVVPEQITRYMLAEGLESEDAGARAGRAMWKGFTDLGSLENFIPGGVGAKVGVELVLNRSFYSSNPIVGKSKEYLPLNQQVGENTSEVAIQLGAAMGASPMKVDYLLRGLTGQLGGFVISMTNGLFHAADGKVTPSMRVEDYPGLKTFTYSSKDKASLEDYYELRDRIDTTARAYRDLISAGRNQDALEYINDPQNKKAFALRQLQTRVDADLGVYRGIRKRILSDTTLTAEQMREKLDKLEDEQTKYLKSLRLPTLRAFAELTPTFDTNLTRMYR